MDVTQNNLSAFRPGMCVICLAVAKGKQIACFALDNDQDVREREITNIVRK